MRKLVLLLCLLPTLALLSFTPKQPLAGVITVLDQDLETIIVQTTDPTVTIKGIKVFEQGPNLVMAVAGCYQAECTYSYEGLTSGQTYYLKVFTTGGNTGEYITIP